MPVALPVGGQPQTQVVLGTKVQPIKKMVSLAYHGAIMIEYTSGL